MTACNKALRIEPEAAAAYNSRGLVHLRMQHFATAIADYSRSLRMSPEQPSARFGLGLAKLFGKNSEGARDIREARQMEPAIDRLFIGMGVLPDRCEVPAKNPCPPGFPSAPTPSRAYPLIAKWDQPMRRQIIRMVGLTAR